MLDSNTFIRMTRIVPLGFVVGEDYIISAFQDFATDTTDLAATIKTPLSPPHPPFMQPRSR